MRDETGNEYHIWRSRKDCEGLDYEGILSSLLSEAEREGYKPCDWNYARKPNIYLRGMYQGETGSEPDSFKLIDDGYIMFVEKA